ncbi:MAG: tyrosine-protein phosphatase [Deltaproteobacteria bacterium]|jgi:protein-tyrosine phosphatase|nr:tyrosine-protein phosphatase [Deltaproteobacteria bacterium]MBT4264847.1 tyrosine-protein phosphatase [Deltaproteobacteria bacterium]MBT4640067.1 tyrosine-protein phosphatase [Deltaproteobacteria bacterium]MBT6498833.1 tyrosine-protein phosphatase [Deltaproteobacteria bacterium]MBT6615339.1 tyrosine-protein phosphatase [Deltaproteobacteria bacterium]
MPESDKSLIDICIERIDENQIKIKWNPRSYQGFVSIYQSSAANQTVTCKLIEKTSDHHLILTDPQNEVRNYYRLIPENNEGIWVGERRVPMTGTVNFRDMGGYRSKDGKHTKWGQLFRGDSLQRATESDLLLIKQMNIGLIFDFRRAEEVQKGPNRFPENHPLEYQHLPVTHGEFNFISALERLKKNKMDWIKEETIIKGYLENAENYATTWGDIIRHLAKNDCPPVFFHCTAGKDRTGICAALILSALQIPRETILSDYLLSNGYIKDVWIRVKKMIEEQGVNSDKMKPFFSAPEYAMTALLDHLEKAYGSAIDFLIKKADISRETIDKLREKHLE